MSFSRRVEERQEDNPGDCMELCTAREDQGGPGPPDSWE